MADLINEIRSKVADARFEFSKHAADRILMRNIITVYEPDPEHWIDFKTRRSTNGK